MVQAKLKNSRPVTKTTVWPKRIPVANSFLGKEEAKAVSDVVKSGWLSMGPKVKEFEEKFSKCVGATEAIALFNGTCALHAVLAALNIKEGDEVILPSLTFISTANAVLYQNAKPVLAECDPKTFNITAKEIEKRITKKTKAIIPVDMNGMPVDYDEILKVAAKYKIPVIADSAESLGAVYKGRKIGSIADIHVFSFFPNKNVTTGEGGMVTVNDPALAKKIRQIRNQGQDVRYHHVILGYNYRMTELQAAIGIEQLKRLDDIIRSKQKIAEYYNWAFGASTEIAIPYVPDYVDQHSWYLYPITVSEKRRDFLVRKLEEANIETRLSFPPIHTQPIYQKIFGFKDSDLPVSLETWRTLIDIPVWKGLDRKAQDFIIQIIQGA